MLSKPKAAVLSGSLSTDTMMLLAQQPVIAALTRLRRSD
jgi:hypothetical protein